MYQEAGYGENWQPAANNARRLDPYLRTYVVFGSLFIIGFIFIIIIVLSLIPLYISRTPTGTTIINTTYQVIKVSVSNYNLEFESPFTDFNPQTIISDTNNRQKLQAALTSLIQTDSTLTGSVVEINTTTKSTRKRRQTSNLTFNLNVISNTSCSSPLCFNQTQSHVKQILSDSTKTTSFRYQLPNSSQIYWITCRLPKTIQTSVTLVFIDVTAISSLFNLLIQIDKTQNQPPTESVTSSLFG